MVVHTGHGEPKQHAAMLQSYCYITLWNIWHLLESMAIGLTFCTILYKTAIRIYDVSVILQGLQDQDCYQLFD